MKRIFFFILGLLSVPAINALDFAKEYEIKAAFLINLASFVTWPERHFTSNQAPFHICILGEDPFGIGLDILAKDRYIDKHPIEIRRFNALEQAYTCEILFISPSKQQDTLIIFRQLKRYPILTVGDTQDFVVTGGMIQFFIQHNRVRLMVDSQSLRDVDLHPSSQLMLVAQPIERH